MLERQTWLDNYESFAKVWREMWCEGTGLLSRIVAKLIVMKHVSYM